MTDTPTHTEQDWFISPNFERAFYFSGGVLVASWDHETHAVAIIASLVTLVGVWAYTTAYDRIRARMIGHGDANV